MAKKYSIFRSFVVLFIILMISSTASARPLADTIGTGFTYQGKLSDGGTPANGTYDFEFTLFDAFAAGNQVGSPVTPGSVNVTNGLFMVQLDFGNVFNGAARYLEIAVRPGGSGGAYTTLTPRQTLSPTPYAMYSTRTDNADRLDTYHASNSSGSVPINNGTLNTNLNADQLDSRHASNSSGSVPINNGTLNTNLNADLLDGQHASNSSGSVPINNGTLNANLNADLLDGQHASSFQARVANACTYGFNIVAIKGDGSISCQADAPLNRSVIPQGNWSILGDDSGNAGMYTSITIGTDGLAVISYLDWNHGTLKVMHCGDPDCIYGNTTSTVDQNGVVGWWTAITIGADGLPVISYFDYTHYDLKVAHCGDSLCSSGNTLTTVDSTGNVGSFSSITLGADSLPVISYYDTTHASVKVMHCSTLACSYTPGNTITTVDNSADVGWRNTSITLGADGLPVISYYDKTNFTLKVLHCSNTSCSNTGSNIITTVDSGYVGLDTSITIGADGMPVISYNGGYALKVLHCSNSACSDTNQNTITAVDTAGDEGYDTSITIGADGFPVISYFDASDQILRLAHCGDVACSSGNTVITLDSTADVGHYTSITVGTDGLPIISYYNNSSGVLMIVHCANAFCAPYFRRR